MTTHLPVARPDGITCPDWAPREAGKKRCAYYLPPAEISGGAVGAFCNLPGRFLCTEWEKANPTLVSQARAQVEEKKQQIGSSSAENPPATPPTPAAPTTPTPPAPEGQRDLFAPAVVAPPAPPAPPPRPAPTEARPAAPAPQPYRPAKEIPSADLEALERLGIEVCLAAKPLNRDVWLVPARTGRSDRFELTFREAATLRLITDAFPGARVTALLTREEAEAGTTPTRKETAS